MHLPILEINAASVAALGLLPNSPTPPSASQFNHCPGKPPTLTYIVLFLPFKRDGAACRPEIRACKGYDTVRLLSHIHGSRR
jgi:hypothetical protein